MRAAAPPGLEMTELFDQSIFVRAAIGGVIKEGVIAAPAHRHHDPALSGQLAQHLYRHGVDPLSILASLSIFKSARLHPERDDAGRPRARDWHSGGRCHVELETFTEISHGKPIQRAILDGAQQIAMPAFVSTLAICIVFVSVVFLTGPAKYLFTPCARRRLRHARVVSPFARTLVPVMVKYLIRGHEGEKPRPIFHPDSGIV
jgi:hypothetical protein